MQSILSRFKGTLLAAALLAVMLVSMSPLMATAATGPLKPGDNNLDDLPQYNQGVDQSIKEYLCTPSENPLEQGTAVYDCIGRLYRFSLTAGAVVLVFFVVLAGYLYITGGETGKGKAKNILLSAVTGMGILLGSYALLNFINPQLVEIRTIQPPIFSAPNLPSCEAVGFGERCITSDGQVFKPGGGVPGSAREAQYKELISKYAALRQIEYCQLSALMQKESGYNYLAVSNPPPNNVNTSASPPTYGINFESVGHGIGLIQIYIYERRRGTSTGWVNGVPARAGAGFGFDRPLYVKDLIDPDTNVRAGSFLWAKNIRDNNGNLYEAYRDYQGPASASATLQKLVEMYNACKLRGA